MRESIRVDIREVVRLIGRNVYTTPDVVIRELIQNAYDSILSRYGEKLPKEGRIEIAVGHSPATLQVTDNGTGMDRQELGTYLSTLGAGLKKAALRVKQGGPIGEFGIGFFSSFMIADEITLTTRKIGTDKVFQWKSFDAGEYEIEELNGRDLGFGTEVRILLQSSSARYSVAANIEATVVRYCDYLDCPIYLGAQGKPINRQRFPWEVSNRQALAQEIAHNLGRQPAFSTSSKEIKSTEEVQLFLALSDGSEGAHKIYCKRMFITDSLKFVPKHLDFVDLAINDDSLSLSLNRESPLQDKNLDSLVKLVDGAITKWLRTLSSTERTDPRFLRVIRNNQSTFRKMALESRASFDKVFDLLLFRIAGTKESLTIPQYLERNNDDGKRVLFVLDGGETEDEERSNRSSDRFTLAAAQEAGILVIGVHSEDENELLRKVCTKLGVTKAALGRHREELFKKSSEHSPALEKVRKNFERFLGSSADLREFTPHSIPLILEEGRIVINSRNPSVTVLGNLSGQFEHIRPLYVHLYRIMRCLDKSGLPKNELVEAIDAVMGAFQAWCQFVADHERVREQLGQLSDRWWSGPSTFGSGIEEVSSFRREGRDFRFRCFIACPFTPPYQDVIGVTKSVLTNYGIYAETAEAIDTRAILEKVCIKIDQCQFSIVDVSESNPNVLFELGVLLARRKPIIIIRNAALAEWKDERVPTDLLGLERIEYRNTSEDLRSKLELICQRMFGDLDAKKSE